MLTLFVNISVNVNTYNVNRNVNIMGTQVVGVRLPPEEVEMLDICAEFLHEIGRIKKPTRQEAIRYAIRALLYPQIKRAIENLKKGGVIVGKE